MGIAGAGSVRGRVISRIQVMDKEKLREWFNGILEIAKAIKGFVNSFRKNLRYGEHLIILCDELERFKSPIFAQRINTFG